MHVYKVQEIKHGTGFDRDARFVPVKHVQPLIDALAMLVSLVDNGSLIVDHSDRRETTNDIERARALVASSAAVWDAGAKQHG